MHGYFVSLKLYDAARLIANPFAYAEHREKLVRDKMDKMAETRIRTKKNSGVKVNKALAEKILNDEERASKKRNRKVAKQDAMDVDDDAAHTAKPSTSQPNLLSDPRFAKVFEDPEFAIDEQSREYALLNPSSVAQSRSRGKTAVEDEEDESDKASSDGLGGSDDDEDSKSDSDDSSDAGGELSIVPRSCHSLTHIRSELTKFDRRSRPGQQNVRAKEAYERTKQQNKQQFRKANVNMVPMRVQHGAGGTDRTATFGQRRGSGSAGKRTVQNADGGAGEQEMSWVPSSSTQTEKTSSNRRHQDRKGVERFGAGLEKGGESAAEIAERDRQGRTHRRQGVRSGSKNVFRRM